MTALLTEVQGKAELRLRVGQGMDMGRPSLLLAQESRRDGAIAAFVGGRCVTVMECGFLLAGDETRARECADFEHASCAGLRFPQVCHEDRL